MSLFRHLLLLIALLAQAWPVLAVPQLGAEQTCAMDCCAALAAEDMDVCGCATTSAPAEPAGAPPASGREAVPQPAWADAAASLFLPKRCAEPKMPHGHRPAAAHAPHPRRAVLFCSFLN